MVYCRLECALPLLLWSILTVSSFTIPNRLDLVRRRHVASALQESKNDNNMPKMDSNSEDTEKVIKAGDKVQQQNQSETKDVLDAYKPRELTAAQMMRAIGTSPRRLVLSFASATAIALSANFLGVTSTVLQVLPDDFVQASRLDTYYPRGDYKRIRNSVTKGADYTFLIPKEWVADTSLELVKAQLRTRQLDYSMQSASSKGTAMLADKGIPDCAFGPPGYLQQRDTNVSVIQSKVLPGFSMLGTMGPPEKAAVYLLDNVLAPPGSGRKATLILASPDYKDNTYQLEYNIDRGPNKPSLQAISVIEFYQQSNTLLTLTVVAPQSEWSGGAPKLREIASSFRII